MKTIQQLREEMNEIMARPFVEPQALANVIRDLLELLAQEKEVESDQSFTIGEALCWALFPALLLLPVAALRMT